MLKYRERSHSLLFPISKNGTADPVKETCRLIRLARSYWDAHRNHACRTHRDMADSISS